MPSLKCLTTRWIGALAIGITSLTLVTPAAASADAGVSRNRIRFESVDQVDEFLSEACGVTVVVDSRFNIHILEFADGRTKVHINSWSTLSSPEGELSTIGTSMIHFEPAQVIDNGDGTHTVVMPHREAVSSVYLIAGANVTDAGIIDWDLRLVIDDATGEVLNERELVVQTIGHFPGFNRDGGVVSLLCDSLTA